MFVLSEFVSNDCHVLQEANLKVLMSDGAVQ